MVRSILFLTFFLISFFAEGQLLDPVKWRYKVESLGDREYMLIFEAKMEKQWTVYSQFTPDDGPVPTSINYEPETGFKKLGKAEEFGHKKSGMDKLFGVKVIKYLDDQPFIIKQKIKADKETTVVSGYLTFMTCNDELCLPPTDVDFNFNLSNTTTQDVSVIKKAEEELKIVKENKILEPVKWNVDIRKTEDKYVLIYSADIEEGWTVYSQNTADDGPTPTSIDFEEPGKVEVLDNKEEGKMKQGPDPLFDNVEVIKFFGDEPFVITQEVRSEAEKIKGYLTYMACDHEKCLPPTYVDFEFDLNTIKAELVVPADLTDNSDNPFIEGDFVDQKIASIGETYIEPLGDCKGGEESESKSMWMSFIFGFLGGLLALLTPCVFPMIPLTVSFFTKDTKRKGWVNGLIYAASIIVIYVALGLLLTAVFGPEALNRLSTNWIANTLFFIIFVAFAFSFFGFYEITLPSSWSTKSDSMADKGGILGIFFMAFTLALVSFSCTGPIIGSAIVSAASNAVGPAVVMLGFAIALALPFGLFAAFPAWLNSLPQSGGWMNSVKVVLGFLELALAFKFLSVADMTNHWNFLKYELFMGIWIIIFGLMALYLFGMIKFPHDSPIRKLSPIRGSLALLTTAFTIYLMTGFFNNDKTGNYCSLGVLSGLAPPAHYNFFKPAQEVDPGIKAEYPSYTMCANNIPCFKDYYEGLSYARSVNKPVFKDFTGFGCVNCRKVEEHIWVRDEIRDKLINDFVLVSLYVDDDKKLDEVKISKRDNNTKIRNVGNKWADFQIVNYGQNTQPLYVMMTPDEKVLAKPRGYRQNEGVKEYNEYMECGLSTYDELNKDE